MIMILNLSMRYVIRSTRSGTLVQDTGNTPSGVQISSVTKELI